MQATEALLRLPSQSYFRTSRGRGRQAPLDFFKPQALAKSRLQALIPAP
jgi:hypothetical protein